MRRIRIGIIGAGTLTEWALLPTLSGPDIMSPPDTGSWWGRRPPPSSDIYYQAPARPEVVALADLDGTRAERVAGLARVRAVYSDWRAMLREVELDAVLCATSAHLAAEIAVSVGAAAKWLWVAGPPAVSSSATVQLARELDGRALRIWCSHSLRHAAAHRAAQRIVERAHIGTVAALALRWASPLHSTENGGEHHLVEDAESPHLASSYAALDLLLHFAANSQALNGRTGDDNEMVALETASPYGARVVADEFGGATSVWLRLLNGVTATALFSGAEAWSTPLPRVDICGTQGRSIVCEAGRRLWLHQPRESAHLLEPPGLSSHVTAANVLGVAEDLKMFLGACTVEAGNGTQNSSQTLMEAAKPLALLESINAALISNDVITVKPPVQPSLKLRQSAEALAAPSAPTSSTLTLPL